jgi:hypothetical protein
MTWDLFAALLVVAAALWLLRWNSRRGAACSSCPATADVRRDRAIADCCKTQGRVPLAQLGLSRSRAASAAVSDEAAVPPVS